MLVIILVVENVNVNGLDISLEYHTILYLSSH